MPTWYGWLDHLFVMQKSSVICSFTAYCAIFLYMLFPRLNTLSSLAVNYAVKRYSSSSEANRLCPTRHSLVPEYATCSYTCKYDGLNVI